MVQLKIRVYGIVQGVGFRPFVSRLAAAGGLRGSVCNKGSFVEIFVQGEAPALMRFQKDLKNLAPERSVILKMDVTEQKPEFFSGFQIIESKKRPGDIFVSPDIAICPTCKTELFDQTNRRYLHPFINCTACGPRLTILKQMPYDRARTTMSEFSMCPECAAEYGTMGDRRYDAQPVCCPDCGPQVYLMDEPAVRGAEAVRRTREVIRAGGIAAIKGIGGFHLCCDAGNEAAVALLRARKNRPAKPFAVMARDLDTAKRICEINDTQAALLDSPQKPIIICRRRVSAHTGPDRMASGRACETAQGCLAGRNDGTAWKNRMVECVSMSDTTCAVAPSVAPDNPTLGVMLPYAPLQLLLFHDPSDASAAGFPDVLVMTSGNRGGAPICRNDTEAAEQLVALCDIVLSNDREILIRADDSVLEASAGGPFMLRRSRGYAPLPLAVSKDWQGAVLAVGGELKNTFCIGKDSFFYPSPYVGDLSDLRCERALSETVTRMLELFEAKPAAVACDLHPGYRTSAYAKTLGLPVTEVQHHFAHILSCMAENDVLDERVIGIAFDGTGYGADGTVWGGEFLVADVDGFERAGSLAPFVQTGGDAAAREGWRIAVSMLLAQYGKNEAAVLALQLGLCDKPAVEMLAAAQKAGVGCVVSTSAGRLFDAVSALLGIKNSSTFEGEAAMALQYAAEAARAADESGLQKKDGDAQATPSGLSERTETVSGSARFELHLREENGTDFVMLDYAPLIDALTRGRMAGEPTEALAYLFHEALADGVVAVCERLRGWMGLQTVALSGGCFCNRLLLQLTSQRLEERGFRVLVHRQIPANDGGIALGQAVYAMRRLHAGDLLPVLSQSDKTPTSASGE